MKRNLRQGKGLASAMRSAKLGVKDLSTPDKKVFEKKKEKRERKEKARETMGRLVYMILSLSFCLSLVLVLSLSLSFSFSFSISLFFRSSTVAGAAKGHALCTIHHGPA